MDRVREFALKRERLGAFLAQAKLDGVVLSHTESFAWLGCGANSVVNAAQETGVGTLLAARDGVTLLANNIETERLLTEELGGLELRDCLTFPWHEPHRREEIIRTLTARGRFAADDGSCGLPPAPDGFQRLRYVLTEAEIERHRALGRDASQAMERSCRDVSPGMTESETAAGLAGALLARGATPVVLLAAADERIRRWRHPLPKDAAVHHYCMLVACARRHGLVAALTRFVHFGALDADLARRHRAVCEVDAAMIAATRPGRRAGEVFAAGQAAYAAVGHADQWRFHHQGGAIGYRPREYIANPTSGEIVLAGQAFAWNPSIQGTKSEDTVLVAEGGVEVLTAPSADWPMIEVPAGAGVLMRPAMLVR
jgi:antitoxin VapB